MNINLHIERLVLDGLSIQNGQGPLVRAAMEAELGRLLSTNSLPNCPKQGRAVSNMSVGDIAVTEEIDPTHLGQQIGRAVHKGVTR